MRQLVVELGRGATLEELLGSSPLLDLREFRDGLVWVQLGRRPWRREACDYRAVLLWEGVVMNLELPGQQRDAIQ